jgi:hypothetical protein
MGKLLEKLNHKGNNRIAVINAEESAIKALNDESAGLAIDREIDPRFPYDFIMIFAKNREEVELFTPVALHNLMCDGVLWFCFPKKTSGKVNTDIDRDHGWELLKDAGFQGIRIVSFDKDWSAIRFRYAKFIKSASGKSKK